MNVHKVSAAAAALCRCGCLRAAHTERIINIFFNISIYVRARARVRSRTHARTYTRSIICRLRARGHVGRRTGELPALDRDLLGHDEDARCRQSYVFRKTNNGLVVERRERPRASGLICVNAILIRVRCENGWPA